MTHKKSEFIKGTQPQMGTRSNGVWKVTETYRKQWNGTERRRTVRKVMGQVR
jgi:hypothetical protein